MNKIGIFIADLFIKFNLAKTLKIIYNPWHTGHGNMPNPKDGLNS